MRTSRNDWKRALSLGFLAAALLCAARGELRAEPETLPEKVIVENYYKLIPGATEEWQTLYTANHYPILRELVKEGLLVSVKLYRRRFHAVSPAWNFKVVLVWPSWEALEKAQTREDELLQELYPNRPSHRSKEQRRWEITEIHWDDMLVNEPLEKSGNGE